MEAATEDAHDLSARLARGEGRLFGLGQSLTVRTLAASLLLDAKPTTFRSLQGWVTTLPMGMDLIGMTRTFDTPALATAFPLHPPTCHHRTRRRSAHSPACCTAATSVAKASSTGTASPATTTTRSSSAAPAPARPTSSSWKPCAACTAASRSVIESEDVYTRLADPVGGTCLSSAPRACGSTRWSCPSRGAPTGTEPPPKMLCSGAACSCTPC